MNRIISLSVEDMYIKYTGEAFGATGSHNAVTLRMTFGPAWEGTAKTAYFTDALGNTSVALVLGLDTLVDGAYEVNVPSEALKTAGVATITIKGILISGKTTTKAITTAAGHFRVLDSELPESAGNAGIITPSDKDQLQAEIAGMEALFTSAKAAAEAAAANAKVSETNAKASETAAASSASQAQASAAVVAQSAANEIARQQAETERANAETQRQANETARQNAETARQNAEIARNFWEDYDSTKSYAAGNKVAYGGSSYLCIKPCTGIAPPNAEYWRLIASRGADGTGSMYFRGTTLVVKSGTLPPSGDYETYSGDYSVKVPFGGDDAVLETGNKLMRDNLTVEAVNVAETTNPAGGKTMIIGE